MRECYKELNEELYKEQQERRKRLKMNSNEEVIDELDYTVHMLNTLLDRLRTLDIELGTRKDLVNGLQDFISEVEAAKDEELLEDTKGKEALYYGTE